MIQLDRPGHPTSTKAITARAPTPAKMIRNLSSSVSFMSPAGVRSRARKRRIHHAAAASAASDSTTCTITGVNEENPSPMKSKMAPTQPKIGCATQPTAPKTASTARKLNTG